MNGKNDPPPNISQPQIFLGELKHHAKLQRQLIVTWSEERDEKNAVYSGLYIPSENHKVSTYIQYGIGLVYK